MKAGLDGSILKDYEAICWAVGINIRTTAADAPTTRAVAHAMAAAEGNAAGLAEAAGVQEGGTSDVAFSTLEGVLQR